MEKVIQRVEVRGTRELRFPDLCANCATPTSEHLSIEKPAFVPARRGGYYGAEGVSVPFCSSCIEAHQLEAVPLTPAQVRRRMLRHPMTWFPLPGILAGLWIAWAALAEVARGEWYGLALLGVFLWTTVLLFTRSLWGGLWIFCSVPAATSVTRAFDFKPQQPFHRWRMYLLRNPVFASAFVDMNGARRITYPVMAAIRTHRYGLLMLGVWIAAYSCAVTS